MFHTVFPSIIRSSRLYIQQQVYVKQYPLKCTNSSKSHTQAALRRNAQLLAYIQVMSPSLTKHSKYMQIQTIFHKCIPMCVSYKQKLLSPTTNFSQIMASHILDLSVTEDGYQHFGRWRQYTPKIWYPCTRSLSVITWKTTVLIFTATKT
jgi:hypothetical protein